jgi:hypothetical protein
MADENAELERELEERFGPADPALVAAAEAERREMEEFDELERRHNATVANRRRTNLPNNIAANILRPAPVPRLKRNIGARRMLAPGGPRAPRTAEAAETAATAGTVAAVPTAASSAARNPFGTGNPFGPDPIGRPPPTDRTAAEAAAVRVPTAASSAARNPFGPDPIGRPRLHRAEGTRQLRPTTNPFDTPNATAAAPAASAQEQELIEYLEIARIDEWLREFRQRMQAPATLEESQKAIKAGEEGEGVQKWVETYRRTINAKPTEQEETLAKEAGINPFLKTEIWEWVRNYRQKQDSKQNNNVNPWANTKKKSKTPFSATNAPVTEAELLAYRAARNSNQTRKNKTKLNKKVEAAIKKAIPNANKNRIKARFEQIKREANAVLNPTNSEMTIVKQQIENNGKNPFDSKLQQEYVRKLRTVGNTAENTNPFKIQKANDKPTNAELNEVKRQIEANGKNPFSSNLQKEYLQKKRMKNINPFTKQSNDKPTNAELNEVKRQIEANGKNPFNAKLQKEYLQKKRSPEVNPFTTQSNDTPTNLNEVKRQIEAKNPFNAKLQKEYLQKKKVGTNPFLNTTRKNKPNNAELNEVKRQIEANGKNPFNSKLQKEYLQKKKVGTNPFLNTTRKNTTIENVLRNNGTPLATNETTNVLSANVTATATNATNLLSATAIAETKKPNSNTMKNKNCPPKSATRSKKVHRVLAAFALLKEEVAKLETLIQQNKDARS